MPAVAYVGLGANLGEPRQTLSEALGEIASTPGILDCRASPLYGSTPVEAAGPLFVNAVARVETSLSPLQLLDALQDIENRHGRLRPYRNAPRTLDLDLLLYDALEIDSPRLVVPHPRMHQRAFVLKPLTDLTPDLVLPEGRALDLLAQCAEQELWPLLN